MQRAYGIVVQRIRASVGILEAFLEHPNMHLRFGFEESECFVIYSRFGTGFIELHDFRLWQGFVVGYDRGTIYRLYGEFIEPAAGCEHVGAFHDGGDLRLRNVAATFECVSQRRYRV